MTTIWIEGGCIACSACVDVAPEIFALDAGDGCLVCGAARVDGRDTANAVEPSPRLPGLAERHAEARADAIAGCPTGCIRSLPAQGWEYPLEPSSPPMNLPDPPKGPCT